jgi:hypothetical protein
MSKQTVDNDKILTNAYLLSQSMNDEEIFKMCILLLKVYFDGRK